MNKILYASYSKQMEEYKFKSFPPNYTGSIKQMVREIYCIFFLKDGEIYCRFIYFFEQMARALPNHLRLL
jgi:hypothetical protein